MLRWSVEILMVTLTVASDNVTAEQGILVNQLVFFVDIYKLSFNQIENLDSSESFFALALFFLLVIRFTFFLRFFFYFDLFLLFYVNHSFTHPSSTMEILYLLHFFSHPMEFLPTSFFIFLALPLEIIVRACKKLAHF